MNETATFDSLGSGARNLLAQLRDGGNIAEPRNYLAAYGYWNLARATLDNANALCSTDSSDDFRVFSALYAVRHGLELFLKSLIVDLEVDRILDSINADKGMDELEKVVVAGRGGDKKMAQKGLLRSLCQFRNLDRGLEHPEFRAKDINRKFCADAIARLRDSANEPRYWFANAWAVPISGHNLVPLWERARPRFSSATYRARYENEQNDRMQLLDAEQVASACELFGAYDPRGDAFRYPTPLDGDLHRFVSISLQALGRFARALDWTVNVYGTSIANAYVNATIKCAAPGLY